MGRILAWMLFVFVLYIIARGSALKYYQILFTEKSTSGQTSSSNSQKSAQPSGNSTSSAASSWDDGGAPSDWSDGSSLEESGAFSDFSSLMG
jgi:hypothetical protein